MSIDALIGQLQAYRELGLPGETIVYVPEKTRLNGADWCSPVSVYPGYDPHPLSAANDGTLVVYVR